ncbi:MAG: fasciclin domain-containing protein [Flavobacteriales bacterium]|nr:fasciclin domain-containing protein [Flavobacteriales bacterium]
MKRTFMKKLSVLGLSLMLLGSTLLMNGCKDDTTDGPKADQNVYELISGSTKYSVIKAAIDRAGLQSVLSGSSAITFFAPVDDAFLVSRTDPSTLSDAELMKFLQNHLIMGKFTTGDFPQPGFITSEAPLGPNGEKLSLLTTRASGSTRVNGSQINSSTDATNGILHEMGDVVEPATIYDQLSFNPETPTFKTAIALEVATKGELEKPGTFTVFAPHETAMTAYLNEKNISISRLSPSDRRELVNNSIVNAQQLNYAEMTTGKVTTRGAELDVSVSGSTVTLNGSVKFRNKDVQCTNGVLHIIDGTLTK